MVDRTRIRTLCGCCEGDELIRCPECRGIHHPTTLSVGILRCAVCHGLGCVPCPDCGRSPRQVTRSTERHPTPR